MQLIILELKLLYYVLHILSFATFLFWVLSFSISHIIIEMCKFIMLYATLLILYTNCYIGE